MLLSFRKITFNLKYIFISVGTILKIENRSISIDFRAENRDFDFCQSIFFSNFFFEKKNISMESSVVNIL